MACFCTGQAWTYRNIKRCNIFLFPYWGTSELVGTCSYTDRSETVNKYSVASIHNTSSWSSSASVLLPLLSSSLSFASQHVSKKPSTILTKLCNSFRCNCCVNVNITEYAICLQDLNSFNRRIVPLNHVLLLCISVKIITKPILSVSYV